MFRNFIFMLTIVCTSFGFNSSDAPITKNAVQFVTGNQGRIDSNNYGNFIKWEEFTGAVRYNIYINGSYICNFENTQIIATRDITTGKIKIRGAYDIIVDIFRNPLSIFMPTVETTVNTGTGITFTIRAADADGIESQPLFITFG